VNESAASGPLIINITPNTNVKTNITIKGTDLTYPPYAIQVNNITYCNTNCTETNRSFLSYNYPSPIYTDWVEIPIPSADNETRYSYFWITIPVAQPSGSPYQGNITVLVEEYKG
jgi:hypothetical protein